MKRHLHRVHLAGLLLAVIFLTGCFQYSQEISLNPDGTGKLKISYSVPKGKLLELNDPRFPTQAFEIRQIIRKNYTSDRVTLDTLWVDRRSDFVRVYAQFSFQSLNDLNQLPRFRNEEYAFSRRNRDASFEQTIHFSQKDWIEASTLYETGIKLAFRPELSRRVKLRFAVKMPFPIDSTNASYLLGKRTAVWRLRLSDLLARETVHLRAVCRKSGKNISRKSIR